MQQLAAQRPFFEPAHDLPIDADTGLGDVNHLLILAIERALSPPIIHRRSALQPMRVVVVDREVFFSPDMTGGIGCDLPRLLPRATQRSRQFGLPVQQRAVRGEILSDEAGRLYEKLGRQIRPLHQLASGPFGDVLDVVPVPNGGLQGANASQQPVATSDTTKVSADGTTSVNEETSASRFVPVHESNNHRSTVSHRKLFADPGQWRVLKWGEFKEILSPQLAHPERLRDSYRLPCYVQVFETEREVSISELADLYKSDGRQARLYFLTGEIAAKLDLVLPLRAAPTQDSVRPPNTLLPHERVFKLMVANDPTTDITNSGSNPESQVIKSGAAPKSLKSAIPVRFIKEWEFKMGREEALYDMNSKPTLGSLIVKICRGLRVGKNRNEFSKWQTLLTSKDIDEQLWLVRPPGGRLADPRIREWVLKTLELGGYDSSKMITEWEIFWRRKGL